jgi:ubiquinone/menaquinone biosynthesis C-methylase UbiE
MSIKGVDYDPIASAYDQRYAHSALPGVTTALLELSSELGAQRILDVGCGTAHWLARLRSVTEQLYGLDLSAGMLRRALERDEPLHLVCGRAGWLPFSENSFDLVCCVNALHHFQEQRGFVIEASRMLRSGGTLAVIGMDPRAQRDRWYIYDYFEGTYETDLAHCPSWGTVLNWMAAAGFVHVEWRPVEHIVDHKVQWAVLDDPFLQKNAISQLILLSDEAYAAGLRRIEAALAVAEAAGETLIFPADLTLAMLVGRLGGGRAAPGR